MRRHLAVADDDARLRRDAPHLLERVVHVVDAVVHPEHLAAAREFTRDRQTEALLVERHDLGDDRAPVRRRRGEAADVAQPEHGHVQRAWDGRGAEREYVRRQPELEQALLVLHAESLLLVDDDQPKVMERDVLRQQPVRADDDVDLPRAHRSEDRTGLRIALEAAEALDAERIGTEPVAERALVLFAQDRRRHEHRDLTTGVDGLEGGADRDLRLAEPHVAADQAIHRTRALHVALGRLDRAELVLGLLPRELGLELALPIAVGRERDARRGITHRLHAEHLRRKVADRILGIGDLALPTLAADRRERRLARARTHVLLHQRDLADRHVQHRTAVEVQREELDIAAVAATVLERRQSFVPGDPMIAVHHVVAGLQVQERLARARGHARPGAAPPRSEAVHQFRLRHEHQSVGTIAEREAPVQVTDGQVHAITAIGGREQFPRPLLLALVVGDEPGGGVPGLVGERGEGGGRIVGKHAQGTDRRLDRLLGTGTAAEGPERDRGRCLGCDFAEQLMQRHEPPAVGHPVGEGAALFGEFTEFDQDRAPAPGHDRGDRHARTERRCRSLGR